MVKMKLLIGFIGIVILLVLINQYSGWGLEDLLPPRPVTVRELTQEEMASLPSPVKIDEKFYRNSPKSSNPWVAPLYGEKKTALIINWNGHNANLIKDFKNLLRTPENKEAYQRRIYNIRSSVAVWKYDSAKQLLIETCGKQAACIINPQTKEIAVLSQQDPSYLAAFLKKYQNW